MWEIFSERLPFTELKLTQMQLAIMICSQDLKPNMNLLKNDTPNKIKELILRCIDSSVIRPTFEEIGFDLRYLKI